MVSTYHSPDVGATSDDDSKPDGFPLKMRDLSDQRTSVFDPDVKPIEGAIRHVSFVPPTPSKSIDEDSISQHSIYAMAFQPDGRQHHNSIVTADPSDPSHVRSSLPGQPPACDPAISPKLAFEPLHPSNVVDRHSTSNDRSFIELS